MFLHVYRLISASTLPQRIIRCGKVLPLIFWQVLFIISSLLLIISSLLDTTNGYEEQQKEKTLEEQGQVRPFLEEDGHGEQDNGEVEEIPHRGFYAVLRIQSTGGSSDSLQSFRKGRPGPLFPNHGRRVSLQIYVS